MRVVVFFGPVTSAERLCRYSVLGGSSKLRKFGLSEVLKELTYLGWSELGERSKALKELVFNPELSECFKYKGRSKPFPV